MPRLKVRYPLTLDAAGQPILRDDEVERIVGLPIEDNATDLMLLCRDCEFHFLTPDELREAKTALLAAGFQVLPK